MFLRIAYRKSDEQIKVKIKEWISELELKNFYNNYYLEDSFGPGGSIVSGYISEYMTEQEIKNING